MLDRLFIGGKSSLAWAGVLYTASTTDRFTGVATDSSGNIYAVGYTNISSRDNWIIAKYNSSGDLQWQKVYYVSGGNPKIAIDGSNNLYVGSGTILIKLNSDGVITWQKNISSSVGVNIQSFAVNSAGQIFCVGTYFMTYDRFLYFLKFDTNGNLLISERSGITNVYTYGVNIKINSNNDIFICGYTTASKALIVEKYNSSFGLQWRSLSANSNSFSSQVESRDIIISPSGDIYVAALDITSPSSISLLKLNSSGVRQWYKNLYDSNGSANEDVASLAFANNGDILITGNISGTNGLGIIVARYSPAGDLQWQRRIYSTAANNFDAPYKIITTDDEHFILCCALYQSSQYDSFIIKLPIDGSLTGSYSGTGFSFTYAISSLSRDYHSLNTPSLNFSGQSVSTTVSNASLTTANGTLNSTVIRL